jgi:hypothetical protein
MNFVDNFLSLIYSIEPVAVLLTAYGLLLILASFIKTTSVYSFTGALAIGVAIVVRVLGGGNVAQVFFMVLFSLFSITVFFLLSVRFSKYGWIIRMPVSREENGIKEIRVSKREK